MKPGIIVLLLFILQGCAVSPQVRTITHEVKIPVPCNPEKATKPASAVDALPLDAEIDEQMRALRADRVRNKAYISQLEKALSSCSK